MDERYRQVMPEGLEASGFSLASSLIPRIEQLQLSCRLFVILGIPHCSTSMMRRWRKKPLWSHRRYLGEVLSSLPTSWQSISKVKTHRPRM